MKSQTHQFWIIFGIVVLGLVFLLVTGSRNAQIQPQAQQTPPTFICAPPCPPTEYCTAPGPIQSGPQVGICVRNSFSLRESTGVTQNTSNSTYPRYAQYTNPYNRMIRDVTVENTTAPTTFETFPFTQTTPTQQPTTLTIPTGEFADACRINSNNYGRCLEINRNNNPEICKGVCENPTNSCVVVDNKNCVDCMTLINRSQSDSSGSVSGNLPPTCQRLRDQMCAGTGPNNPKPCFCGNSRNCYTINTFAANQPTTQSFPNFENEFNQRNNTSFTFVDTSNTLGDSFGELPTTEEIMTVSGASNNILNALGQFLQLAQQFFPSA